MKTLPLFIITALLCASCTGGFYHISSQPNLTFPSGSRINNLAYITTTVSIRNDELFTSPKFISKKDSDLSHLYIYAEFNQPPFGDMQIPLFLYDFTKHNYSFKQGAELISKLPFSPNERGKPFFTIKTRALETNQLDLVMDIWESSQSVIAMAAGAVSGGSQILDAVNSGTKLLKRFESKEFNLEGQFSVSKTFQTDRISQVFFITQTDSKGNQFPEERTEVERAKQNITFNLTPDDVFLKDNNDNYYKELPYIVLDTHLSEFVSDKDVIPKNLSTTCSEITETKVALARSKIETLNIFSELQKVEERNLIERAAIFHLLDTDVNMMAKAAAVDHFAQYMKLPTSNTTLYAGHFKAPTDMLTSCANAKIHGIPGAGQIIKMTELLNMNVDSDSIALSQLESILSQLSRLISNTEQNITLQYIKGTNLFESTKARLSSVEDVVYDRFFRELIGLLKVVTQKSDSTELAANQLQTQLNTSCEKCKLEANTVLIEYRKL